MGNTVKEYSQMIGFLTRDKTSTVPRPMVQEPRNMYANGLSVDPVADSGQKIRDALKAYENYRKNRPGKRPIKFKDFFGLYATENMATGGSAGQLVRNTVDGSRPGYKGNQGINVGDFNPGAQKVKEMSTEKLYTKYGKEYVDNAAKEWAKISNLEKNRINKIENTDLPLTEMVSKDNRGNFKKKFLDDMKKHKKWNPDRKSTQMTKRYVDVPKTSKISFESTIFDAFGRVNLKGTNKPNPNRNLPKLHAIQKNLAEYKILKKYLYNNFKITVNLDHGLDKKTIQTIMNSSAADLTNVNILEQNLNTGFKKQLNNKYFEAVQMGGEAGLKKKRAVEAIAKKFNLDIGSIPDNQFVKNQLGPFQTNLIKKGAPSFETLNIKDAMLNSLKNADKLNTEWGQYIKENPGIFEDAGFNLKTLKKPKNVENIAKNLPGINATDFKEVINNSKRGGALLTNEMLNKSEKFKKVKICKTKFANGGGGLCGKAYAEKYPQEFLQEVMKDSRMASYLKSKEALAVGKSFLSKTAKVGRWANPLTLVGGEAWYSVLAGINEFSKGKSLGEAVNEGLWFIPGKHSRDLNELLGSKAKGKKGRNLPIIPNEVRSQFDILTQLGVLINKEGALSGQLSMQQYETRRLEEEKTKRLFQERFEPKEISQDPNYYTNLLGDINWSKNIITPQIEKRLENTMTEGDEVFQKYKAADPEGQSYLKLQDKIKSKIVDEFNKGKTWDQADPHSGSIWNWIKTRENIPFTDPDLVAKQKKLDLLKEGPDQTITKENIPPELIENFLMKFPEYKYTFEGAEGGLAGLMKKYYD